MKRTEDYIKKCHVEQIFDPADVREMPNAEQFEKWLRQEMVQRIMFYLKDKIQFDEFTVEDGTVVMTASLHWFDIEEWKEDLKKEMEK